MDFASGQKKIRRLTTYAVRLKSESDMQEALKNPEKVASKVLVTSKGKKELNVE
jgi:hypothetical protein